MNQLSKNRRQISTLLIDVFKQYSTKSGFQHIIQIVLFEILRRKLPTIVRFVKCFLFGSKLFEQVNGFYHKIWYLVKGKKQCEGEDEKVKADQEKQKGDDDQMQEDAKNKNKQYNPNKQLKTLKELMVNFFKDNWKDNAQYIRDEVVYHFNIEKLLNDINQNLNIEKKSMQWENLKKEVFSFVPFSIVTSTLLICTQFLREVMKKKYADSLQTDYPALHDPQEITCQIINEFFEQINLIGMKNVKAFAKQKLTRSLQDLSLQESFHIETIFGHLDEYFLNDLLKSNSSLKKPADHKKRSSMTLFRNNRRKQYDSSQRSQTSSINFTDFNEVLNSENGGFNLHHLITSRVNNKGGHYRSTPDSENSALLAHQQPVIAPNSKLDIIYLFLGDISDNKILQDNEFIEKHIEIADCKCREQRYQPSLQCIPEAEDDDGYESDKSEVLPHSSNSNGKSGGSSSEIRNCPSQNIIGNSMFQHHHHYQQTSHEQSSQNKVKYRKLSDGIPKNGTISLEDYFPKKDKYHEDKDDDEDEEEIEGEEYDDDDEDEDIGYTKNDQFLLELKGSKKGKIKKNSHLIDQHHQANQRRDIKYQIDHFKHSQKGNLIPTNQDNSLFNQVMNMTYGEDNQKAKKHRNENKNKYNSENYFQKGEEEDEIEEDSKLIQSLRLSKHKFLSQEDGDEEDYHPTTVKQLRKVEDLSQRNGNSNGQRSSNHASNDMQMFIQKQSSPKVSRSAFETQDFISNENETSSILDEEEIIENRQRLTHFLQSLCFEALEILESTNFQTYLYYAVLFQYKKFKNRFRIALYENNMNKNMVLMNIIIQIHKILEEHFLSEDAQEKCDSIYQKYKIEVENLMKENAQKPSQSQLQNIKRIFEEVDQSIIIRESFEELTKFFIHS